MACPVSEISRRFNYIKKSNGDTCRIHLQKTATHGGNLKCLGKIPTVYMEDLCAYCGKIGIYKIFNRSQISGARKTVP